MPKTSCTCSRKLIRSASPPHLDGHEVALNDFVVVLTPCILKGAEHNEISRMEIVENTSRLSFEPRGEPMGIPQRGLQIACAVTNYFNNVICKLA